MAASKKVLSSVFFTLLFICACLFSANSVMAGTVKAKEHCEVTTPDGHDACVEGHTHGAVKAKPGEPLPNETWAQFKKRDPEGYKKYKIKAYELQKQINESARLLNKIKKIGLERQSAKSRKKITSSTNRSSGCSNDYGGPSARSGQYICSNHGELLACQCGNGQCNLIHTGAIQCTSPGAIIN